MLRGILRRLGRPMFVKLMKQYLALFLMMLALMVVFFTTLHITARAHLGHWPDERETKCEGRRFFEMFAEQNWADDLGCGK
jgi:hypothetical protein